jgi:hypothetical protein
MPDSDWWAEVAPVTISFALTPAEWRLIARTLRVFMVSSRHSEGE